MVGKVVDQGSQGVDWSVIVSAPIGGAMGAGVCFPFESIKKKLEAGRIIERGDFFPRELYRGSTSFAASVSLATLTQMTFHRCFQSIPGYDPRSLSQEAASSLASGMLGALVGSTPVENIILTQQANKVGSAKALEIMFKQGYTRPWVGLPELALREAGFAGTMLCGIGAVKGRVLEKTESEALSHIAGIGVGILGASATQPFDVLATVRQVSDGSLSSLQAVETVYQARGVQGFFKGLNARILLFVGCATIIPPAEKTVATWMRTMGDQKEV